MRPRLPLCLLPFVSSVALLAFSSVGYSATITVSNTTLTAPGLGEGRRTAFDLNAPGTWERDPRFITTNNTFLDDTTLNFAVTTGDGMKVGHPSIDYHFTYAVTLDTGSLPYYQTKHDGIGIAGGKTLEFTSSWAVDVPQGHRPWVFMLATNVGGEASTQAGMGNVVINLNNNSDFFVLSGTGAKDKILLGAHVPDKSIDYNVLGTEGGSATGTLPTDPHNTEISSEKGSANFIVQGNVDIQSGMVVYADQGGTFKVGNEGLVGKAGQSKLTISNMANLIFTAGEKAEFYSNVIVDRGVLVLTEKTNKLDAPVGGGNTILGKFHSGLTVQNLGVVNIYSDSAYFGTKDNSGTAVNIIDGGKMNVGGKNFVFNSAVNISGFAQEVGPMSVIGSTFTLDITAKGGIFTEDVTVTKFGAFYLNATDVIFKGNLNILDDGIFHVGNIALGDINDAIVIEKGLNLGKNARVEVDTQSKLIMKDSNGDPTGFEYTQGGYFALFGDMDIKYGDGLNEAGQPNIVFSTMTPGATVYLTTPLTAMITEKVPFRWMDGIWLTDIWVYPYMRDADGNYIKDEITGEYIDNPLWAERTPYPGESKYKTVTQNSSGRSEIAGIIKGNGNVGLELNTSRQRYVLSGENIYTGDTILKMGLMEVTSETRKIVGHDAQGNPVYQVVSGSLGAGNSSVVFSNEVVTNVSNMPIFALTKEFKNLVYDAEGNQISDIDPITGGTADYYKNMVIGDTAGVAFAYFVSGSYLMLNSEGTFTEMVEFANDVYLHGNISAGAQTASSDAHFVKLGTGKLSLVGTGQAGVYQASYKGNTIIKDGVLELLNYKGVASLNPDSWVVLDNELSSRIPIVKLGADTAPVFANNIQFRRYGQIDASDWKNGTLTGNIYNSDEVVVERRLELVVNDSTSNLTLAGQVGIDGKLLFSNGKDLIVTGQLLGDKILVDLGGSSSSLIFNPQNVEAGKVAYFAGKIQGGKDLIKEGKNELVLLSDLANSKTDQGVSLVTYSGATIVRDGKLTIEGVGKLGATKIASEVLYSDLEIAADATKGEKGILSLTNTQQTIAELSGKGLLDMGNGQLTITAGNTVDSVGVPTYFGGDIMGAGVLTVNLGSTANAVQWGLEGVDDKNNVLTPPTQSQFSGIYRLLNGTLSANSNDVLSHNATVTISEGATLKVLQNSNQVIGNLYSGSWVTTMDEKEINSISDVFTSGAGGIIDLGNNSSLTVGANNSTGGEYSGRIIQDVTVGIGGSFIKTGTGKFTLKGTDVPTPDQFTYTGKTIVNNGTLVLANLNLRSSESVEVHGFEVPASGPSAGLEIPTSATLVADLTKGNVEVTKLVMEGGVLDTNTGGSDYKFTADSAKLSRATLVIDAKLKPDNSASYSSIAIDGYVDLVGKNTIDLRLAAGNWATGHKLTLFTAKDPSQLKGLEVVDQYIFLSLNRDDTVPDSSVTVDIARDVAVTFDSMAATGAQRGVARALDVVDVDYRADNAIQGAKYSTLGSIMNEFYIMKDASAVSSGMQSLSGYGTVPVATAQLMDLHQHQDIIRNRATLLGSQYGVNTQQTTEDKYSYWALGSGDATNISGGDNVPEFDKSTWSGSFGIDTDASEIFSYGGAFSYVSSDISVKGGDSSQNDAVMLDAYGHYRQEAWSFVGVVTLAKTTADTERRVSVGDFNGTARGSSDGYQLAAFAEAAYEIKIDNNWIIQPLGNLTIGYHNTGSYNEAGLNDAGLAVDSVSQAVVRLGAGARARYTFEQDAYNQKGMCEIRALIVQDLTDISPDVSQGFIGGSGAKWDVNGSGMGKTAFQVGAGVNVFVESNVSLFADVNTEFRSDASSLGGNLGVRVTF